MGKDAPCPKCNVPLEEVVNRDVNFLGCTSCYGLWVAEGDLAVYVEKASTPESATTFALLLDKAVSKASAPSEKNRRHCPLCGVALARIGFGESPFIILDRCNEHGLWLDRTELKKVVRSCRAAAHPHGLPEGVAADDDDDDEDPLQQGEPKHEPGYRP